MKYFEKELLDNVNKNNIQGLIDTYKKELNDRIAQESSQRYGFKENIRKEMFFDLTENSYKWTKFASNISKVQEQYNNIEMYLFNEYPKLVNKMVGLHESEGTLLPSDILNDLIDDALKVSKKALVGILKNNSSDFETIATLYLLNANHHIYDFEFICLIIEETLLNKAKSNVMWLKRQELIIESMKVVQKFYNFEDEDNVELNSKVSDMISEVISKQTMWLKHDNDKYYKYTNKEVFFKFKDIIAKLDEMNETVNDVEITEEDIKSVEDELGVKFNNGQKEAIVKCVKSPVTLLSGEAGTGKTTVAKGILKMLKRKSLDDLCIYGGAFTGKASQHLGRELNLRMTAFVDKNTREPILEENGTLDRLLFQNMFNKKYYFHKGYGEEKFNADNTYQKHQLDVEKVYNYHIDESGSLNRPVPAFDEIDVLIIDECSMLSMPKFYDLVMNMRDDARVIMIGDIAQLPPVNDVALLNELKHSDSFVQVHLTEPMRQQGNLYKIIKQIRNGKLSKGFYRKSFVLKENGKVILRGKGQTDSAVDDAVSDYLKTTELLLKKGDKKLLLNYQKNTRALAFKNKDVNKFNNEVIYHLLSEGFLDVRCHNVAIKGYSKEKDEKFYVNERVMITSNLSIQDKSGRLYPVKNGETGTIVDIVANKSAEYEDELLPYQIDEIFLQMDNDDVVKLDGKMIKSLVPAYAMTIHKSQGMTIDNIIMMFDGGIGNKELIYTGVSRAKRQLTLFIDANEMSEALEKSVYNEERVIHPYF